MEEAVRKLSGKAADALHIKNRGYIREGYYADICIFNPEIIADKGTFTEPEQYPEGIEFVFVNGRLQIENGNANGCRAGKVLCLNSK